MVGEYFRAFHRFGHLPVEACISRQSVCKPVVVGTKIVPTSIRTEYIPKEIIEPEHEEDIIEYQCESILSNKEALELLEDSKGALNE